jgi:hypothetical protein
MIKFGSPTTQHEGIDILAIVSVRDGVGDVCVEKTGVRNESRCSYFIYLEEYSSEECNYVDTAIVFHHYPRSVWIQSNPPPHTHTHTHNACVRARA